MQSEQPLTLAAKPQKEKIFTFKFINIMIADILIRICTYMLIALVPLYVLDRGFSPTVAGLTTTFYMLMAVFFRPASGKLVDTKGRYIIMIIGSAVYCVATGLFLFVIPVWVLLGIRALQGFGFSFNGTALMTLATDNIPEHRMAEGIGYLGLMQTVAQAFAPALALLLKNAYGYEVAFIVVFIFAIINLASRFTLQLVGKKTSDGKMPQEQQSKKLVVPEESTETKPKQSFWTKIVDKDAWKPSLIMFFVMFSTTSIGTFLVAYATRNGIENPGSFFTVTAIMVAIARLTVGKLHQKLGTAGVIAPGIIMICISLIMIFSSVSLPVILIAGACYGLGIGAVQPEINSMAVLAASKENRGLANSTFFMAMDLSQAIAAMILGAIAGFAGLGSIFGVCACIAFLTMIAYLIMRKRGFVQ